MKRFIVEQIGYVQLEASRRFVVELPDHISEEEAQELVESGDVPLPDEDGMEWTDELDQKWIGYDVEIMETDVYDPEPVTGSRSTAGLRVVRLEGQEGVQP